MQFRANCSFNLPRPGEALVVDIAGTSPSQADRLQCDENMITALIFFSLKKLFFYSLVLHEHVTLTNKIRYLIY